MCLCLILCVLRFGVLLVIPTFTGLVYTEKSLETTGTSVSVPWDRDLTIVEVCPCYEINNNMGFRVVSRS